MFSIMGITGKVGGEIARNLLAAHKAVRGVVRDPGRAQVWPRQGCELVAADIHDAMSLTAAFQETEGVFLLVPPSFDPLPKFPEAHAIAASLRAALEAAQPGKAVYLSTIGAQATRENLLSQHTIIEKELRKVELPITFLRPGWFLENCSWDLAPAKSGRIPSFLQPLDKPVRMVATEDIGRVAAEFLQETWSGHRTVELEGPRPVSPNEIGTTFAKLLGHSVKVEAVPRETWESLFKSQGMKNPTPRIQMLDGFNEGWIEFEGSPQKGIVGLESVLRALIEQQN